MALLTLAMDAALAPRMPRRKRPLLRGQRNSSPERGASNTYPNAKLCFSKLCSPVGCEACCFGPFAVNNSEHVGR
jgi:hypothetical protein